MKTSFDEVLDLHTQRKVTMRIAANTRAIDRVVQAGNVRGLPLRSEGVRPFPSTPGSAAAG